MKKGKLYGVGVGPGDPELLTLKALRIIEECNYIAYPGDNLAENIAYGIISKVARGLETKHYISCNIRMTKDPSILEADYFAAVSAITGILDAGEDVAFLTIGDPTIYSTYMNIHRQIEISGYNAAIISGIPSFCAAAAAMDTSLCERSEQLHIIPSNYDINDALSLPGNKIFMKPASHLPQLKDEIIRSGESIYMIENCGMDNERICRSAEEINETAGYLSLIIVKEN